MEIPIYQVDAFSSRLFAGNPAAVCPLPEWLPDEVMQAIAAENNLAETAFFVPEANGYHLRWFTPKVEVDLCGHATLATAHILYSHLGYSGKQICFNTLSGELTVSPKEDLYTLDFPSTPPQILEEDPAIEAAMGSAPLEIWKSRDYLLLYENEKAVQALQPDMKKIAALDCLGVMATAPGKDCDFVSRFFAPAAGIDEDPVTGSAHTTLTPFWSKRLQMNSLHARQISARGGELFCEQQVDRVLISGRAVTYLTGRISL